MVLMIVLNEQIKLYQKKIKKHKNNGFKMN